MLLQQAVFHVIGDRLFPLENADIDFTNIYQCAQRNAYLGLHLQLNKTAD